MSSGHNAKRRDSSTPKEKEMRARNKAKNDKAGDLAHKVVRLKAGKFRADNSGNLVRIPA